MRKVILLCLCVLQISAGSLNQSYFEKLQADPHIKNLLNYAERSWKINCKQVITRVCKSDVDCLEDCIAAMNDGNHKAALNYFAEACIKAGVYDDFFKSLSITCHEFSGTISPDIHKEIIKDTSQPNPVPSAAEPSPVELPRATAPQPEVLLENRPTVIKKKETRRGKIQSKKPTRESTIDLSANNPLIYEQRFVVSVSQAFSVVVKIPASAQALIVNSPKNSSQDGYHVILFKEDVARFTGAINIASHRFVLSSMGTIHAELVQNACDLRYIKVPAKAKSQTLDQISWNIVTCMMVLFMLCMAVLLAIRREDDEQPITGKEIACC